MSAFMEYYLTKVINISLKDVLVKRTESHLKETGPVCNIWLCLLMNQGLGFG